MCAQEHVIIDCSQVLGHKLGIATSAHCFKILVILDGDIHVVFPQIV